MNTTRNLTAATALIMLLTWPGAFVTPLSAQENVQLRGLVDVVAQGEDELRFLNTTNVADSNFDPLRARLFVEAARGNTQVFIQFLFSQEARESISLFGAYLMHKPFDNRNVFLEVGKIPVHDGIWASTTYSDKNPLIAIPLAYFWKSTLPSRMMPTDMDQLLAASGRGQTGVVYADSIGLRGRPWSTSPMLYDNCWNYGAYSLGTLGNFEYAAGATMGAPGAPVASTNTNDNLTLHAKLGYALTPGLKFWASVASGAYLSRDVSPYLPAGKTVNDYKQDLFVISGDWKWNHLWVSSEVFFNRFDTPLRPDGLSNRSFYGQAVYTLSPGWDLAVRYDEMRYETVETSSGLRQPWDRNIYRIESGVVYHVSRDLIVKGVLQANDLGDGYDADNLLPAVQLSFKF